MIHLAHLVVPFLIGNVLCSKYEGIGKDVRNTMEEFLTGEEKLAPEIGWDRDEPNKHSGINENPKRFRMYLNMKQITTL